MVGCLLQRPPVLQHGTSRKFFPEFAKVNVFLAKDLTKFHVWMRCCTIFFYRWGENLLNCEWQGYTRLKVLAMKWSSTRKHDSGCGCLGWFAKDFSRVCSAKAVAKEKVPIQAHSPSSSPAPLQRQGNLSSWNFIVSWWNYPNMAFYLPLAVSQITRTVAVYIQFESV